MSVASVNLMKIQVVDGSTVQQTAAPTIVKQPISAARGEIIDANGDYIVQNKVGFNVIIEKTSFPSDKAAANEVIIRTVRLLQRDGYDWNESIPVSKTEPYEFTPDSEKAVSSLKTSIGVNVYATAENCIDKLIADYNISSEYTAEEKRIIAGIRYEMLLRDFSPSNIFTLSEDIGMDLVTEIKELGIVLPGVTIVEDDIRQYLITDVIPHEIGTVGPIFAEEYAELKNKGYAMNDTVGKSGLEKGMEDYLRGTSGIKQISMQNGTAVSDEIAEAAVPGNTVKLTIDSSYQREVQKILEDFLEYLRNRSDGKYTQVNSGAIAVLDVNTGGVLALATAPTYNLNDYINNYSDILKREGTPLINRATDGLYRPGSAFKTVTATAGLAEGVIDPYTTFRCQRRYQYYDINVGCTGYHNDINVTRAIQVSCNIFFYELSRKVGIDTLSKYAELYGIGTRLGLESGDSAGHFASPATFEKLGGDPWTSGQLLQAAIGQSETAMTPLQMATVASTIANKGVRYTPHLVDSIYSYNMDELILKKEPEVAAVISEGNTGIFDTIKQGMIAAAKNTPAGEYSLNDLGYNVAIKTGTPQVTTKLTNSTVIGFAPAEKPQIAFAVVIEGGEYAKYTVRKLIDAYFN